MRAFVNELLTDAPELETAFSELIDDMPRGPARARARRALREYCADPHPARRGDRRDQAAA